MLSSRYIALTQTAIPGGFGSVQTVHDTYLDRPVLYKSMLDVRNNHQIENEILGLSRARSRHVVEIYDVVRDQSGFFAGVVIEYLTGRDYRDFYREASVNVYGYLMALFQLSTAIADLHSVGVVHRDIKLDNFKESASGILKLFDFGISSFEVEYRTTTNRGTQVYAAPELYQFNAQIRPELDVYALGICAWALASNVWPSQLLERPPQQTSRAPSIDSVLPGLLAEEVVGLIDDCLHPDPSRRPLARIFSDCIARHLVAGKHRGIFVHEDRAMYELSHSQPSVNITIGTLGRLSVRYTGLGFLVTAVTGTVYMNNIPAAPGLDLPQACVLCFGDPSLGPRREWVTFSSSHPEVVL